MKDTKNKPPQLSIQFDQPKPTQPQANQAISAPERMGKVIELNNRAHIYAAIKKRTMK